MITEARGIDGEIADTYGTYMSPTGVVQPLDSTADGIEIEVVDQFMSPRTGAVYPWGWAVDVRSLGIEMVITPVGGHQEVRGGLPAASTYWEGKSTVLGHQNGAILFGDAYVELSGYVDPDPIEWMQRR